MASQLSDHLMQLFDKPVVDAIQPWKEEMIDLIRYCSNLPDLAKAIRYYAFHYDTYLNAATRDRPFWKKKLIKHFVDDMMLRNDHTIPSMRDPKTHESYQKPASFLLEEIDDEDYTITVENNCTDVSDPLVYLPYTVVHPLPARRVNEPSYVHDHDYEREFSIRNEEYYIERDENFSILFDYYLATIKYHILFMFHTFTTYAIPTTSERQLYRCMVLEEGTELQPLTGCTSTTYHLPATFSILSTLIGSITYNKEKSKKSNTYTNIILIITVPVGIYYLPSAICTLYSDENEIILLSQCTMTETKREHAIIRIDDKPTPIEFRYVTLVKQRNGDLPSLYHFRVTDDTVYWGKNKKKSKNKK